jgi:hypothetical protein
VKCGHGINVSPPRWHASRYAGIQQRACSGQLRPFAREDKKSYGLDYPARDGLDNENQPTGRLVSGFEPSFRQPNHWGVVVSKRPSLNAAPMPLPP